MARFTVHVQLIKLVGNVLQGALVGGLTGALSAIPIPGVNTLLSGAFMGTIAGGTGNLISQISDPCVSEIDWQSAGLSALAGAIGGAIGAKIAGIKIKLVSNGPLLDTISKNPLFTEFGKDVVGNTTAGVLGGGLDVLLH